MPKNTNKPVFEVVRYGIKGASTMLLNILVMMGLVEFINIIPEIASILSTTFVIIIGWILMNRFVFPDAPTKHGSEKARKAGLYYLTIMIGKLANYALFLALLYIGVWYPVAWVLGGIIVFFGLFGANRYLWHGKVLPT